MSEESRKEVVGIVAASHCELGREMLRVTELIVGPLQACKAISFQHNEPVEGMIQRMQEAIKEVDRGRGVLILTDLFGGTPANISLSFLGPKVEVVCGMNLPMLIKLASCRGEQTVEELASMVKEYGQRHISLASEVLAHSVKPSSSKAM
jgi:PTS system mannose-specific IIA component